jgi:very-short-patch-repair endonuclease
MARVRGTTPEIEEAARQHRRAMTPAELVLWRTLSGKKAGGLRFRSQHPVGRFILDFCCPAHKLAVEVDGDTDDLTAEYDAERTKVLAQYGYRVLRFRNEEVIRDVNAVVGRIIAAAGLSAP